MFLSFVKHGPTRHLDWSVGPTLALLFGAWDHMMNWVSTLLFMFFKPHLFCFTRIYHTAADLLVLW